MADLFTEVYNWLPLCHLINKKVLVRKKFCNHKVSLLDKGLSWLFPGNKDDEANSIISNVSIKNKFVLFSNTKYKKLFGSCSLKIIFFLWDVPQIFSKTARNI